MLKACLLPSISRSLSLIRVVYWPFPTLNQIKIDLDICIAWEQLFSLQKSEGPKKLTMFNPLLAGQRTLSTPKLYKVQCSSICAFMFVCGCAGRCEGRRKTALWSFIVLLSQLGRLIVSFILSKQHNNSSRDHFQKTKKQKKNVAVHVFAYLSSQQWQICCILIQSPTTIHPLPHSDLWRKCLWSFLSVREGGNWGGRGVGWQTGDRPSSLSPPGICPLLPTLF